MVNFNNVSGPIPGSYEEGAYGPSADDKSKTYLTMISSIENASQFSAKEKLDGIATLSQDFIGKIKNSNYLSPEEKQACISLAEHTLDAKEFSLGIQDIAENKSMTSTEKLMKISSQYEAYLGKIKNDPDLSADQIGDYLRDAASAYTQATDLIQDSKTKMINPKPFDLFRR